MSAAFTYCAAHVLGAEGGLVDHPRDPGGRTNLGITQATLNEARRVLPTLPATVDALTRAHALEIYERLYWRPVHGDELPLPIALLVFDASVNQGPGTAARMLQAALGVATDGAIGPKTLAAVARANVADLATEIASRRMYAYMLQDSLDDTFGLGWSRRLCAVFRAALALHVEGAR